MELLDNFKPNDSQLKNEHNRNKQHKIEGFNRLHIKIRVNVYSNQKIQNCENLIFFGENEIKKNNFQ